MVTPRAIIVLGMHRSGTSALAGALGMVGMRLPDRLMVTASDNPKGHFEPEQIVAIHDRLLTTAGLTWSSIGGPPEGWFDSAEALAFAEELAAAVRQDYADAELFVVKDPRMCRLMPLWRKVLAGVGAQARFAIPLRNPLEVARSLEKRNGLPLRYGCLLWLSHALEAERETRGAQRVFIHFHDLLSDPIRTAEYVAAQLVGDALAPNEQSKRDIASLIDPELRHQVAEMAELHHTETGSPWLSDAYEALATLVSRPTDMEAKLRLDRLWVAFNSAVALFAPLLAAQTTLVAERDAEIASRDRIIANKDAALLEQQNRIIALDRTSMMLEIAAGTHNAQLEEILRSTGWRLLAPLRWFGRQRSRVAHFLRQMSPLR